MLSEKLPDRFFLLKNILLIIVDRGCCPHFDKIKDDETYETKHKQKKICNSKRK